jgi:predicted metal-dependent phosphotriesterase family hydrolase
MSFIRTVLGDIPPQDLGVCSPHEHLIIDPSFTTYETADFLLDSVEAGIAELREFHAHGGRAMVDSMPCDSGRNVLKLAAIARGTGVHIVAPTGLHLQKYYDPGHWGNHYDEQTLSRLFVQDLTEGVDAHDYNGPVVLRTEHRAGVIKVASGLGSLTARDRKVFAAAAAAQRATGCPILTHTEQGTAAIEQLRFFQEAGVELRQVCLSHTDRNPDLGYHREILSAGVRVEFDSAFRWKSGQGNPTRDLVCALLPEIPDQIMLGMDAARRAYWKAYGGGPGLSFLITSFRAELQGLGVGEDLLERVFIRTPADWLRWRL